MTNKTNTDQMRAAFEKWYMQEFEVYPKRNESGGFKSQYVNAMFKAFSAGRDAMQSQNLCVDALAHEIRRVDGSNSLGAGALSESLMPFIQSALQPQKPEPKDLMLSGVIRMPFEMAMADQISRLQFYHRAQQALNELEAMQSQDRDADQWFEQLRILITDFGVACADSGAVEMHMMPKIFDHARRIEENE